MEAFMPDFHPDGVPKKGAAPRADKSRLKDMCDPAHPMGPYHLINTHLVITKIHEKHERNPNQAERWRLRGGDSFLLSPRYCGSKATGWCRTEDFMSGFLSLAAAMAISGAAVNPDAANAGVGPQRSTSFALLMALLNIRLGYWTPNPNDPKRNSFPNHFRPGLSTYIDRLTRHSHFLELTDGGNFENLGVYELLRRRVRTILVCDVTADPGYVFSDLQNLLSRAEADFRIAIEFISPPPPLSLIMPVPVAGRYPAGVPLSQQPFVKAKITYCTPPAGMAFYLKPAIFSSLRLHILGFKGTFPDFPDDPTADEFFSEARFEAYRELGFISTEQMLADLEMGGISIFYG